MTEDLKDMACRRYVQRPSLCRRLPNVTPVKEPKYFTMLPVLVEILESVQSWTRSSIRDHIHAIDPINIYPKVRRMAVQFNIFSWDTHVWVGKMPSIFVCYTMIFWPYDCFSELTFVNAVIIKSARDFHYDPDKYSRRKRVLTMQFVIRSQKENDFLIAAIREVDLL